MGRAGQFAGKVGYEFPDRTIVILYHNPLIYSILRPGIRNHFPLPDEIVNCAI